MVVATSGPPGPWTHVEVDLLADYTRAFGRAAPAPLFLALMTDTDNGCSRARAAYADFWLAPRLPADHWTQSNGRHEALPTSSSKRSQFKPSPSASSNSRQ